MPRSLRVAPTDRSVAERNGGTMPAAIASLRTDGGTTFAIATERARWSPDFSGLVEWLTTMSEREWRSHNGKVTTALRLPDPAAGEPDPRMRGWSEACRGDDWLVPVEAWVSGRTSPRIYLHVQDRCFATLSQRKTDEGVRWDLRVQVKAREVYADGLNAWMVRWLGFLGWLTTGDWCTPTTAAAIGWRTSEWHLNSDFTALDLRAEDAWLMLGWRRMEEISDGEAPRWRKAQATGAWAREQPYFAQSIYLGRSTSDTCLLVYRKSEQLRDDKQVKPRRSMYAPLWLAGGWDGVSDVTRVELRLRKKALTYVDATTRETLYDFRDPALLLDQQATQALWHHVMRKRRLTCEDASTDRETRKWVDPAWLPVMGVDVPGVDIRQCPRGVRRMTQAERIAKTEAKAVSAAIAWASQHGADVRTVRDAGRVLMELGRQLASRRCVQHVDSLPKPPDTDRLAEYAHQMSRFFSGEADACFESLSAAVSPSGPGLERIDWGKVRLLPPPRELEIATHDQPQSTSVGDPSGPPGRP